MTTADLVNTLKETHEAELAVMMAFARRFWSEEHKYDLIDLSKELTQMEAVQQYIQAQNYCVLFIIKDLIENLHHINQFLQNYSAPEEWQKFIGYLNSCQMLESSFYRLFRVLWIKFHKKFA